MQETPSQPPSREETALLINSIWSSLIKPDWKKDDLIEFGKIIFAKVSLRDVDASLFNRLLPHLKTIASHLTILLDPSGPPPNNSVLGSTIKTFWEALIAPTWRRQDLITLGTQIHDRRSLKDVDADTFKRVLPNLTIIAQQLAPALPRPEQASPASSPTPTTSPAPPSPGPEPHPSKET